uniref:DUF2095 domain-containing protein n=1 Tax=Geoglobus ahangari TaxID=113653 RepID=A0A7C4W2H6_9EURY
MEWEKWKFRRMFPNLFREIEGDVIPTVLDHLERCRNFEEAYEIIDYFEKRGEITKEYAEFLKSNKTLLSSIIGTRSAGKYEREGLR